MMKRTTKLGQLLKQNAKFVLANRSSSNFLPRRYHHCSSGKEEEHACNGGGCGNCKSNNHQPTHSHHFSNYTTNTSGHTHETVNIFLNGIPIKVPSDMTILEAQRYYNEFVAKHSEVLEEKQRVDIPTLCYHPRLHDNSPANCRICLVEEEINPSALDSEAMADYRRKYPTDLDENHRLKFIPSCTTKVREGGVYWTRTKRTHENVRSVLKFLLSHHNLDCPSCTANNNCELQTLLETYHISKKDIPQHLREYFTDTSSETKMTSNLGTPDYLKEGEIRIDPDKCIRCTRCMRTCHYIQERDALSMSGRGHNEQVQQLNLILSEVSNYTDERSSCITCGQCSQVCPVGAITINSQMDEVSELLMKKNLLSAFPDDNDVDYVIVASTAPAVRVAISEEFGKDPGHYSSSQLVAGLKKLGFDYVFDTLFSADLTIMEEANELVERLSKAEPGPFPMYTSCCPGWINLVEKDFPEIIPNVSSCKSPQQMLGAVVRQYWTKKMQHVLKGKKVIHVSIMPCTAKKYEAKRPEMSLIDPKTGKPVPDIDFVLTTRELGKLFKMHNINDLEEHSLKGVSNEYDSPIAEGTGAAVIFGVTGGVMEAALRTAYETVEGKTLPRLNFTEVRGLDGIRSATITMVGKDIKVGIAHGSGNLKRLVNYCKTLPPEEQFHFIEMMACPSGCVGGGGEPKINSHHADRVKKRLESIYKLDEKSIIRKSHENKEVKQLYDECFGEPLSHSAHEYLHTHYTSRK
ncbi:hypothetical protein ABK040_009344 [Willaertia magna]